MNTLYNECKDNQNDLNFIELESFISSNKNSEENVMQFSKNNFKESRW